MLREQWFKYQRWSFLKKFQRQVLWEISMMGGEAHRDSIEERTSKYSGQTAGSIANIIKTASALGVLEQKGCIRLQAPKIYRIEKIGQHVLRDPDWFPEPSVAERYRSQMASLGIVMGLIVLNGYRFHSWILSLILGCVIASFMGSNLGRLKRSGSPRK